MKEFLKESLRLYLSYMAVGFAALPVAAIYATYSVFHGEKLWALIPTLIVGLICGGFAYRWMYRKTKVWVL